MINNNCGSCRNSKMWQTTKNHWKFIGNEQQRKKKQSWKKHNVYDPWLLIYFTQFSSCSPEQIGTNFSNHLIYRNERLTFICKKLPNCMFIYVSYKIKWDYVRMCLYLSVGNIPFTSFAQANLHIGCYCRFWIALRFGSYWNQRSTNYECILMYKSLLNWY